MSEFLRKCVAACLSLLLALLPGAPASAQPQATSAPTVKALPLHQYLQKPYMDLFELAPSLTFSASEVENERQALKSGASSCRNKFKEHAKTYGKQLETARSELKKGGPKLEDQKRHILHCRIQNLELLKSESEVLSAQAIPNAYDNLNAKLDLLLQWPEQSRLAFAEIASGAQNQRRWGDVKDIGFRDIAPGQRDDIKRGQEAVDQLKRAGMLPPEVENKAIQQYVKSISDRVAQHSDLKVPLHVAVLQSREINLNYS